MKKNKTSKTYKSKASKKTYKKSGSKSIRRAQSRQAGEAVARESKPAARELDLPTVAGVLDCKGDRFGFIAADGGDVFVAGRNLCGARHGDTVRAIVIGDRPSEEGGRRREGRIVEITERNPLNVVATVVYEHNRFCAVPDDKHYGELLPIYELNGASEHDKVIIDIKESDRGDLARVLSVLGRFDDIGMDVLGVIVAHNLRTEFPSDVLDQADSFGDEIDAEEASAPYRADFRDEIIFTIDGSGSKDFDDAVSLVRRGDGYRLGVYIADVAQYVGAGTPLDREAFARGTSVYLADRVLPMLPESLSNGLCSLNEGADRLVLAALVDLDGGGNVVGYDIKEGVICSAARLTYTGVQAMLDGDAELRERYAAVVPTLELMRELAEKRIRLRKARGAVDFKLTETEIKFDAVGHVVDIEKKNTLLSMRIIEEFMILANCAVAEKFDRLKVPFVYRTHERPSPEKLQALNEYLDAVGAPVRCPLDPEPRSVAKLLETVDEKMPSASAAVSKMTLRAMAKAKYDVRDDGHFGLAEDCYCHFTSPIRRYPDLMIHRVIKAYLRGGNKAANKYKDDVKAAAEQSSRTERVAQECERKVDDYKKAEYMSHRIGERFTGVISSVTEFGFFVELENSAEGLVRLTTLPPVAAFDRRRVCIVCGSKRFGLGDSVDIVVDKVSGDRVDFVLG